VLKDIDAQENVVVERRKSLVKIIAKETLRLCGIANRICILREVASRM